MPKLATQTFSLIHHRLTGLLLPRMMTHHAGAIISSTLNLNRLNALPMLYTLKLEKIIRFLLLPLADHLYDGSAASGMMGKSL